MHERESALREWISRTINSEDFVLKALAGDASFRRYYRLFHQDFSYVIMDAPPQKESLLSFISVATTLDKAGVPVPKIIAQEEQQGFLLLSDLGDELLLKHLNEDGVDFYYQQAMRILVHIQNCSTTRPPLPVFDKEFMIQEMALCPQWFLKLYLNLDLSESELVLIDTSFEYLATEIAKQPFTFIHRDFHSRNLMLTPDHKDLSVIDFQDAMKGPVAYDLVSLLKDCYIAWPREQVLEWVASFHKQSAVAQNLSLKDFISAFDFCGIQRHLKVLGIFSRLHLRDNKSDYLKDLPLVLNYTLEACKLYPELHALHDFLQKRVHLI